MTELRRTNIGKAKLGVVLLLAALTLLLTACPGTEPVAKPEITLSVDKPSLPDGGGDVILKADVTKGTVTSVTFKRDKGGAIPPVTTPNADGDFVTTARVSETTTFTATATGPGGTTTTPPASSVKVTVDTPSSSDPKAPSQTFKTYREITFVSGITPTDFSASSAITVAGIEGDVRATTDQATAQGGTVTINAGKNVLAFSYKPQAGFIGDDSFEYTVSANGKTATGRISVSVGELPSKISKISTLSEIAGLPEAQTIILTKQIFCNASPCIRLKNNQVLTGLVTTTDGVTITSPTAGIIANIPGTRQPGTASGSGAETRVVELADNTTVEGIEITGEGQRYFVAIFGATYEGSSLLEGNINIKNVTVKNSNGKPLYFKCSDFPCSQSVNYGAYNLTMDNLRVESAFDTLVIGAPGQLTFKNSFVDLRQPTVNNQDFGDNVGIDVEDVLSASVEFNNVDVFMESPKKNLDDEGESYTAVPFTITNRKSGSTTDLTVANCDITFGEPDSNWSLSSVRTFKLSASSGATIAISSDSLNNTSEATGNDVERTGNITGEIGGLE